MPNYGKIERIEEKYINRKLMIWQTVIITITHKARKPGIKVRIGKSAIGMGIMKIGI